uniref:CalB n=1 Tax=uncultured Candidatus Entotheonella sp. TaxID=312019 RepID=A0A068PC15_9BACT|nr:CalB [uncultured Candidatus Entotheonella sp.]
MNIDEQLERMKAGFDAAQKTQIHAGTLLNRIERGMKNVVPSESKRDGALASAANGDRTMRAEAQNSRSLPLKADIPEPIAITGLSGYLPGCASVHAFWEALDQDRSLIEEVPASRFDWRTMYEPGEKSVSRWGGFIPDIRGFDAHFFGILPAEAKRLDPRQRLLLMSVYQTLEDAGYASDSLKKSRTGVFVALEENEYAQLLQEHGVAQDGPDQAASLLPNRISYFFDFRGPSEFVDTMCSGAAVALHRAVTSLRMGEIDRAIVAGANLILRPDAYITLSRAGQLSPCDTVHSFGEAASGHVRAEGVASLLLTPLSQAVANGDAIYAVIRNTAINYNGRGGTSMAAPNPAAHADLIRDCYEQAGIDVRRVGYIESQGMGNPVADLAEWQAYNRALTTLAREQGVELPAGNCRISTLKPMSGHMEAASALGALLKIIRAFHTHTVHQILNFTNAHPDMEIHGTPCRLLSDTEAWPSEDVPRMAGLHAYGTGGNNAHILLEEYREDDRAPSVTPPGGPFCIPLSAANEAPLRQRVDDLHRFLVRHESVDLANLAFTLQTGRTAMAYRVAFVVGTRQELIRALEQFQSGDEPQQNDVPIFSGRAEPNIQSFAPPESEPAAQARFWVQGGRFDWPARRDAVHRISLPIYPFETLDYWFGETRELATVTPDQDETSEQAIRSHLISALAMALRLPPEKINCDKHLQDYGIDSLMGTDLIRGLEKAFSCKVYGRDLLAHPSINALSAFLAQQLNTVDQPAMHEGGAPAQETALASEPFPLSANQQGLWILQKVAPEMCAYNFPLAVRLVHKMDAACFKQACQFLLQQHPILTHTFEEIDAQLQQRSKPLGQITIVQEDISHLEADQVSAYLQDRARIPFALDRDPLIRFHLLRRGEQEWIVLLVLHHIIVDGFSIHPLYTALLDAYQQLLRGATPVIAPPSGNSFRDFVAWERHLLQGDEGERLRTWWHQNLSGRWPTLNLPTDRPRTETFHFRGRVHQVSMSPDLSRQLFSFAQDARVNLAPFFLALYQLLLYRYTGQQDILVGMPTRSRPEGFETTIGYFTNLIPIRTSDFAGGSFADLLQQVQVTVLDSLDHRALPFPEIVRDMTAERTELTPVFQALYEYQNFFSSNGLDELQNRYQDFSINFIRDLHQEGEAELVLEVVRQDDQVRLHFKYNPDLFSDGAITRMAQHYLTLAEQAVAEPDRPIETLNLLSQTERQTLLNDWNQSETDYPRDWCVHDLFERQAAQTPTAVALRCGDTTLTYSELDRRSTILACYLQSHGVSPGTRVAIFTDRSVNTHIGLMGVLKAGSTYIPLDPDFPVNRLVYMLEDSQALMALTVSQLQDKIAGLLSQSGRDIPIVCLDTEWQPIAEQAAGRTVRRVRGAEHLAYIIYTSGSSGRPKGVMIPHRALTNFLLSMAQTPGITASDTLLAVTTTSFDMSVLDLYLPLVCGATIAFCPSGIARDVEMLKAEIRRHKPTIMQGTPPTWAMLFHSGWQNEEKVRIICGGESLPESLRQRFAVANCEVWHTYGPTETTVWSSVCRLNDEGPISIGKPIANTEIYILDRHLAPLPVGIAGELCIAGDGLAHGYLNRPDLTADRFIAHPFRSGARLYRTGDLARWLPDGTLEHLGRMDFQVKVRGYRIELSEIETRLAQFPNIRECVVVAREDESGGQLIAYYLPSDADTAVGSRELVDHLAADLPGYMIPALFFPLTEFPLNNNGKIDRKVLMNRPLTAVSRTHEPTEPVLPQEQAVLEIWKSVLSIDAISTTDGFFEVGGDSLRAVLLAERIGKRFGVSFTTTEVFRHASVQAMAQKIASLSTGTHDMSSQDRGERQKPTANPQTDKVDQHPDYYRDSLAIVGISCHFPDAEDHATFWQNLREGHDSAVFLSEEQLRDAQAGESLINDPNFIPFQLTVADKNRFDNAFFNISHKNAGYMDPQLRRLLQHAWLAVEDAGYVTEDIPDTGVFIATSNSFYQAPLYQGEVDLYDADAYVAWVLAQPGSVATMIAYQLGLKGPAFAVHSNCSSSLVGLNSAWQSLRMHETRQALVGAASLMPSNKLGYVHQPGLNFAGDGRCKTFDADADGMVGGEGLAVVMLKRAEDAIADGDHIYALLRGVAVNNDGRDKAGFYAPGIGGQADVIRKALDKTGIDPESIGYVEAHGTGTRLGDPVEVAALTEAYRQTTEKRQYCGIGSVKSNIGHMDTAAGLAGLIKIALSLNHGEIPPTLHYKTANPEIDFAASPFYVADRLHAWPQTAQPRRAALSSFGLGGTNTHAIFEAYPPLPEALDRPKKKVLVLLSAANAEQLRVYAERLHHFLQHAPADLNLDSLAYTLQVGRKAMRARLAFVVKNRASLLARLEQFLAGEEPKGCYQGTAAQDAQRVPEALISGRKFGKLSRLWVAGARVVWKQLYHDSRPRRMSLPAYPFAGDVFTLPQTPAAVAPKATVARLHPLLHRSTATSDGLQFSSRFTGHEFFLSDHVVNGRRILPGVAYLEMARVAMEQATKISDPARVRLRNVVWVRPLVLEEQPETVHTRLVKDGWNRMQYEIVSEPRDGEATPTQILHGQGVIELMEHPGSRPRLDLGALRTRMEQHRFSADQCYTAFATYGISYGPAFRALDTVYADGPNPTQLLACLRLPEGVRNLSEFVLHPSMLDAAIQSSIGFIIGSQEETPSLPFALEEVGIYGPCSSEMWALVRRTGHGSQERLDIDLCDQQGRVCVELRGFSNRPFHSGLPLQAGQAEQNGVSRGFLHIETPVWNEMVPAAEAEIWPPLAEKTLLVGGSARQKGQLRALHQPWPSLHEITLDPLTDDLAGAGDLADLSSPVGHVIWIAPDEETADGEAIIEAQERGVLQLFHLVKTLLATGYGVRPLGLTLITTQAVAVVRHERIRPAHAAVHGFAGSLAQEYTHWKIRLLDLESSSEWPAQMFNLPPDVEAGAYAWRGGTPTTPLWFQQALRPVRDLDRGPSRYRHGGVYVVIGGAGGIGEAWSRSLIETYQAHIIWIGRRPLDDEIRSRCDALAHFGPAPRYIQADASERGDLERARAEIRQHHPCIHGLVHAALVLDDGSLANLDENRFRAVLKARIDVSVRLSQVFQEPLDFVLFHSSMTSFDRAAGQSNYAAGCTFEDAFAHQLSQTWPVSPNGDRPLIRVVNWGYWGSVGAVSAPVYRERMEKAGVGSIEVTEGLTIIDHLLSGSLAQMAVFKTLSNASGETPDAVSVYPESIPAVLDHLSFPVAIAVPSNRHAAAIDEAQVGLLWALLQPLCGNNTFSPADLVTVPDNTLTQWAQESCRILAAHDFLEPVGNAYRISNKHPANTDPWQAWTRQKAVWLEEPSLRAQIELVEITLKALPDILAGRQRATEVLFPNASMERVEGIYKDNPIADYFNDILSDALMACLQQRLVQAECLGCTSPQCTACNGVSPIRILEIGAGTGGTTAGLLPRLQPYEDHLEEYGYTDLSQAFLIHARKHYAPGRPWLTTRIFNVSEPLADQDIQAGSYDLVIATNVLHATADIRRTLRNVKAALKKNGILFLNEISRHGLFDHLTFGLLDGWWLHEDEALRIPGCPGLTPRNWEMVLRQEGFSSVRFPAEADHDLGQQIVLAQSDGLVRQAVAAKNEPRPRPVRTSNPVRTNPPVTATVTGRMIEDHVQEIIRESLAEALAMAPSQIHDERSFAALGVDSITAVRIVNQINQQCDLLLPTTILFDHTSVDQLTAHILAEHRQSLQTSLQEDMVSQEDQMPSPEVNEPEVSPLTEHMVEDHVRDIIRESLGLSLHMPEEQIRDDRPFSEYGVDSIIAVQLVNRINQGFGLLLQTTVLFDYNSVNDLTTHILEAFGPALNGALSVDMAPSVDITPRAVAREKQPVPERQVLPRTYAQSGDSDNYRHLQIRGPGDIDDLSLAASPLPELGKNEVRIAVCAFSLNFADLLCVRGLYPNMPPYPFTPGDEAAGIVLAVGDAVTRFQVGDAVVCMTPGCHTELLTCPEGQVYAKSANLSFEEACSLPIVTLTMLHAFRKADLQPGERILIQTAAGGVGLAAVQLAQHAGAEIYATAGSQAKLDYLRDLGVPHLINYRESDFEAELLRLTGGEGVDVVINTLSGDSIQKGLNCLRQGGRYIEIAMAALKSTRSVDISVLNRNQTFFSIDLGLLGSEQPERIRRAWEDMSHLLEQGVIRPTVSKVFPFEAFRDAYRSLDHRDNIGKVVVQLPPVTGAEVISPSRPRRETVPQQVRTSATPEPIAIIGMSARFAQSENVQAFWEHLAAGHHLVEEVNRWDLGNAEGDGRCRYGSFLEHFDHFDAAFFNISEEEATFMDPQQRLFLEECWKALEDAGHGGEAVRGSRCSVYVGCCRGDYPQLFPETPPAHAFWGNEASVIPARISYVLDLHGPAVAVDTACSSSLVAVHDACRDLWSHDCDMALAGGVFVQPTPEFYRASNDAGMLSPTGKCHSFDKRADGFVPGEGVGVILLKRLADAEADGDHVYAVIRGSGVNQDGSTNGLTAPGARSQERLIREVYDRFQIDPEEITMMEAHGTGTHLGDAIEFEALSRSFRKDTDKVGYCALGSVKTNIGHASTAAGISGVIKILQSLQHGQIPPSLHFESSSVALETSPFFLNQQLRNWVAPQGSPRCAAISSFGFSGTNAHLVIAEAPPMPRVHEQKPSYPIVLSAQTALQLEARVTDLLNHLRREDCADDLGNISYTLLTGRKHWHHRLACVVRSTGELANLLERWLQKGRTPQIAVAELSEDGSRRHGSLEKLGNQCIQACLAADSPESYLEHLATVTDLYLQGCGLAYEQLFKSGYARVPLPTYPFQRKRYMVAAMPEPTVAMTQPHEPQSHEPQSHEAVTDAGGDEDTAHHLREWIADRLQQPAGRISTSHRFFELGLDSVQLTELARELQKHTGDFPATLLFEHITIADLASYLAQHHPGLTDLGHGVTRPDINRTVENAPLPRPATVPNERATYLASAGSAPSTNASAQKLAIAVVGISGQFPQAKDLNEFWSNIEAGRNSITTIPAERQELRNGSHADNHWGGFLEDIDRFDPLFFGISPTEATFMDPQQRLLLIHVWRALEDAAITSKTLAQRPTGVFTALASEEYEQRVAQSDQSALAQASAGASTMPNRISQILDLCGPSANYESACSSSILALHHAVQAMRNGECEQAIVAAANLILSPDGFAGSDVMGNLSSTGRVRSFQAEADGYVRAEGVGAVLLKPLHHAVQDRDHVHAMIRGTGVAHGGRSMSLTAPNANGMQRAMVQAFRGTDIDPCTLSYIEAHGTGTPLGDGIEVRALQNGYRELVNAQARDAAPHHPTPIHLGSIKPCIGNGEIASGMAQLLKVILAIRHQIVPGIPGFITLHEQISLQDGPFQISAHNRQWDRQTDAEGKALPRRAGINSYGISGVNAHVVVEEYLPRAGADQAIPSGHIKDKPQIIVLSARNPQRLKVAATDLLEFLLQESAEVTYQAHLLRHELCRILARLLGVAQDEIEADQSFEDHGVDPLQRARLHEELSEVLAIPLASESFQRALSPVALIGELLADERVAQSIPQHELSNAAISTARAASPGLADLAYTLQVGRVAMEYRLALVVESRTALIEGLKTWLDGGSGSLIFSGNTEAEEARPLLSDGPESRLGMAEARLANAWAWGEEVPWETLHQSAHRVSLPGYPFEDDRYWIDPPDHTRHARPGRQIAEPSIGEPTQNRMVRLKQMIGEILGIEPAQLPTRKPLSDLGFSSLCALSLKSMLEQEFNREIPLVGIDVYATLEQLTVELEAVFPSDHSATIPLETRAEALFPEIVPNPEARFEPFPLSDIQEAFLLGRRLGVEGDQVGCHVYLEMEFGDLDIYRLNRAWQRLIDQHDMLRVFMRSDGSQQVQAETPAYRFRVVDLRRKPAKVRSERLEDIRERMSHKVYEAKQWPLFEIRVSVCPDRQIVHFSIDELILDASGIDLLFQQWQMLYDDADAKLPQADITFRDYILAVKKFETTRRYRDDLDFKLEKLKNLPKGPALPLKTHLEKPGNRYRRLAESLDPSLWRVLKGRAEQCSVSPTALMLGIFSAVLHAHCGPDAFSLILTRANRDAIHPHLLRVVGPFISTSIFITPGQRELKDLILLTQQRLFEDLDRSSASGIRILRELRSRRWIDKKHFLPVVFTSLLGHQPISDNEGFNQQLSCFLTQTPQVFLDHQLYEHDGKLRFSWDVINNYFEPGSIDALFRDYCQVLRRLAADINLWDDALEVTKVSSSPFPLTDQQQAYAFGRTPYGAGTNTLVYLEYDAEELDIPRLEQAWRKLMETHDMLVTSILSDGTAQHLKQVPDYAIVVADLRTYAVSLRQAELQKIEQEMMSRVCPLDDWPYFELRVSRIDGKSRIHLAIDMIIADGPSIDLLLCQLFDFYRDPQMQARPPAYTFRDYIMALEAHKQSPDYGESLDYWKQKFSHMPSGPELPSRTSIIHETERFTVTIKGWTGLRETAERLSVSPGMILLTAYAEVLAAWSSPSPFTIVIPCWQRPQLHPAINEVVGDFTAMSWLVVDQTQASFEARVIRNHRMVQEDLAHMKVSGLKVLRRVMARQNASFPVVFTDLSPQPNPALPPGFAAGRSLSRTPQVHMDNTSTEFGDCLELNWDVQRDRYPQGMVARMFVGYQRLLDCLRRDPKSWTWMDFDSFIDAEPEKYQQTAAIRALPVEVGMKGIGMKGVGMKKESTE